MFWCKSNKKCAELSPHLSPDLELWLRYVFLLRALGMKLCMFFFNFTITTNVDYTLYPVVSHTSSFFFFFFFFSVSDKGLYTDFFFFYSSYITGPYSMIK